MKPNGSAEEEAEGGEEGEVAVRLLGAIGLEGESEADVVVVEVPEVGCDMARAEDVDAEW